MKPTDSYADYLSTSYEDFSQIRSPEALRERRVAMQGQLKEAYDSRDVLGWNASVNDMHDRLMKHAVELCEHEMEEAGFGRPPVSYAFVVFGSAGRREQTLWSDQDNGLILSDTEHADKERYFEEFGRRLTDILETAGYEKCEGKVMCSEPRWRRTSSEWAAQLETWRSDLSWEPVRYLIIASDFRMIAGDANLAESWKRGFYEGLRGNADLHAAILRNTVRHKKTLNVLGQVMTERFGDNAGDFDVKYGMYIPLVNAARFMALQHGVEESSTLRRMQRLIQLEAASLPLIEPAYEAFLTALRLRSMTEITERAGLLQSSGYLPNAELKKKEQFYELRDSLILVRKLHRVLQRQLRFAERRRA